MTATTAALLPALENIPEQLAERPQWVCWRTEEREGLPTKVPYTPGTLERASSTDLMTWRRFETALTAYQAEPKRYDGIGFVFCSADPYVGIDLDKCRDPETGEVAPWAQKIVDEFAAHAYVELSPSSTGIHIITEGKQREAVRRGPVEVYGQERFFTFTGRVLTP
jgi:putative DNA primase/helicase